MAKTPSKEVAHYRAKLASFSRSRNDKDPELLNAKQALAEAKLLSDIEKLIFAAPPLSDTQSKRLRSLLGDSEAVKK
jgi:hypothetical protein